MNDKEREYGIIDTEAVMNSFTLRNYTRTYMNFMLLLKRNIVVVVLHGSVHSYLQCNRVILFSCIFPIRLAKPASLVRL